MDAPTEILSTYAATLTYGDVHEDAIHGVERCLIDSLACALGGYDGQPSRIARLWALQQNSVAPAYLLVSGKATSPEAAAYANGMMIRYLDCNDTYRAKEGGHPSDAISAVLAAAEAAHADGSTTLLGLVVAYEVFCALNEAQALGPIGIDHCLHVAVGAAAGSGAVMGLSTDQMANAVSLSLVPNVTLRVAREGRLSMWKGAAAPDAARRGLFAAQMAALGMTGPEEPFLGSSGLSNLLGYPPEPLIMGGQGQEFHTGRTNMKFFPAEYHAQAPIWAALELRERLGAARIDEIEHLEVFTYAFAYKEIGSGRAKWNVFDRETADHSLPYLVGVALLDGELGSAQFTGERIGRLDVQNLISRTTVTEDPALTGQYPALIAGRIEMHLRDGQIEVASVGSPKGHTRNPLSDDDLILKFRRFAKGVLTPDAQDHALSALAGIKEADDIVTVLAAIRA